MRNPALNFTKPRREQIPVHIKQKASGVTSIKVVLVFLLLTLNSISSMDKATSSVLPLKFERAFVYRVVTRVFLGMPVHISTVHLSETEGSPLLFRALSENVLEFTVSK